jgi:hypothetical protein
MCMYVSFHFIQRILDQSSFGIPEQIVPFSTLNQPFQTTNHQFVYLNENLLNMIYNSIEQSINSIEQSINQSSNQSTNKQTLLVQSVA